MALSISLATRLAKDTGVEVRAIAATSLALARVGGMAMEADREFRQRRDTRNLEQGEFGHDRCSADSCRGLVPALCRC